eukprot:1149923-Pelagomonas_calceolata.AAC.1
MRLSAPCKLKLSMKQADYAQGAPLHLPVLPATAAAAAAAAVLPVLFRATTAALALLYPMQLLVLPDACVEAAAAAASWACQAAFEWAVAAGGLSCGLLMAALPRAAAAAAAAAAAVAAAAACFLSLEALMCASFLLYGHLALGAACRRTPGLRHHLLAALCGKAMGTEGLTLGVAFNNTNLHPKSMPCHN